MAASSIRFGPGCTKEVGMDFKNMDAKKVCVVTDKNVSKLDAMNQVQQALGREGVEYTIFEKAMVEPKDYSYACSDSARAENADHSTASVKPSTTLRPTVLMPSSPLGAAPSLTPPN